MSSILVSIVDNDCCAGDMVAALVRQASSDFEVLWRSDNPAFALEHCLYDRRKPDVLIMDMVMDGISGVQLCRQLRMRNSQIAVLAMTSYVPEAFCEDAIEAEAQALLSKRNLSKELAPAIRNLASGGTYPPNGGFHAIPKSHSVKSEDAFGNNNLRYPKLSEQERLVLSGYSRHLPTAAIANQMSISADTVYTYVKRAMHKLGATSRGEALITCRKYHLL